MNKKILISGLASLILMSGCISTSTEEGMTTKDINNAEILFDNLENSIDLQKIKEGVYKLELIDGLPVPVVENNVTVTFSNVEHFGNVLKGNAGCNNYFTKYDTMRSVLITKEIATTDNKCSADQVTLESFIFKIYSQNPIIAFNESDLYFKTTTNVLKFKKDIEN